jgi:putative DNA primase/helicase
LLQFSLTTIAQQLANLKMRTVNVKHRQQGKNMDALQYSIEGEGYDEAGRRYFQIEIEGSAPLRFAADTILAEPGKLFSGLANAGVNCFSSKSRAEIIDEVQSFTADKPSFRVATKLGSFHKQYVLPDKVYGSSSKLPTVVVLDGLDLAMVSKYRTGETLEKWQSNIAAPCDGNSRLMFALSLAFTGPTLPYVKGPRTGGFQLSGPAEAGKSTAASVPGTVWGCHVGAERKEKGFSESWHTTAGKVELTALAHNETILILDETQRAGRNARQRAEVISDAVFSLAEGNERERLTNASSARGWRLYYLSTSNLTFSELARAGGIEIDDAYLGRLFDIPCPDGPHGIYDTIHDFSDGEHLTDALKQGSRRYFGTAGREFLSRLQKDRNDDLVGLKKVLSEYRARYRKAAAKAIEIERLRSLTRTSSRFATVFAAGCLAIRYGILPWSKGDLLKAILECQLAGLRQLAREPRGGEPTEAALRAKLIGYLREAGGSFADLGERRPRLGRVGLEDAAGYVGTDNEAGWFYLTAQRLNAIIGNGTNATTLKRRLIAQSLMAQPKQGFVVQRKIFRGGKGNKNFAWVFAFNPAIVGS